MNADDPKFTAHVLGEFDDLTPAERAEIEALIANDPAAAAAAEETRALVARLRAELPGEAAGTLQEEQRAAVLEAASAEKVVRFPRLAAVLAAIAACVIVGISYGLLFRAYESGSDVKPVAAVPASSSHFVLLATPAPTDPIPSPTADLASKVTLNPAPPVSTPLAFDGKLQEELKDAPQIAALQPAPAAPALQPMVRAEPAVPAQSPASSTSSTTVTTTSPPPPEFQFAPATAARKSIKLPVGVPLDSAEPQGGAALSKAVTPKDKLAEADASKAMPVAAWARVRRGFAATSGGIGDNSYGLDDRGGIADKASNANSFDTLTENAFLNVPENPLSTFSIDVDTASYAIVRRYLNDNHLPPTGAVRIEELLNYFPYDYPQPQGAAPFSATMEVATCPWAPEHRLVRVGLKGREIPKDERPPSNLVFLIDVSGSMNMPNKLPLLQKCFSLLVEQLGPKDRVSIVTYASGTKLVLEPTQDKEAMQTAIDGLHAGGGTHGSSGIDLAYRMAQQSFIPGGTNRVILATDGDWNIGITNQSELLSMITRKAKSGVFLTVLGFGLDNLKDSMLVKLADHGNGHYAYIDTEQEARKVFVDQLSSTLVTIAKDVKIQVEFNPVQVSSYRLVGYEKRLLAKEDFNNDKKDAGEIGAGHTVTALYEVVPVGKERPEIAKVDELKYQRIPRAVPVEKPTPQRETEIQEREKLPSAAPAAAPVPAAKAETPAADGRTGAEKPATEEIALNPAPGAAPADGRTVTMHAPHKTIIVDADRGNNTTQASALAEPSPLPASVRKEMLTLKLRYKEPDGEKSKLLEFPLTDPGTTWEKSSPDFHFAAAVASYGMLLRDSKYLGEATWQSVVEWAREGLGADKHGYRTEFLSLLDRARAMKQ
ncbi:von Willebrand factor type A [Chthoniobacter flavus Ellin428]|uniref:von Willebrand factor type A n=1 Tax=Chthoniobacter flavus Ellin428 TaxID=497964 RepID=B4DA43_9BACT|nr:VWA domain-containing protein [Chthoniobacter flavus]EDY16670.1 von Willebrand factor type A [Chthoniobacter flavus Ellin428]TCO87244.1 secreted protein with Ig-like and vWFA domain [Chthoniobacter flavus]